MWFWLFILLVSSIAPAVKEAHAAVRQNKVLAFVEIAVDHRRVIHIQNAVLNGVVIFIKDTDGDIANQYMENKVGAQYTFDKLNEFETTLKWGG